MVTSVALYLVLLALLYGERGAELLVARRNARLAFARGGIETGRGHYRAMVLVHALFPAACAAEVLLLRRPFPGAVGWAALGLASAAQGLRWWVIATLGARWSTRVIVVPGDEPETAGPYRWLRHPNYLAVLVEAAAIPLVHGAWICAVAFPLASAALLAVRIPLEERALGGAWERAFAGRPRLFPRGRRG